MAWRLRVLALVAVVPPLLHVWSLHRIASRLDVKRSTAQAPDPEAVAQEVDRWLTHLPWPWRSTCLKRAGVLYALLRRGGVDVGLHIGIRRDEHGALAAHAWLIRDGSPYLESAANRIDSFKVIARFPETALPA